MRPINVLSLFDGMSCGAQALHELGISVDWYGASEIDPIPMKVSDANFDGIVRLGGVEEVTGRGIPNIDLLIAGSPCQGFSNVGRRMAFDDPRSKLFWEFVRIKNVVKPTFFLLENVKMKPEWAKVITAELGVEPLLINSKAFTAQSRPRLYWTNIPGACVPSCESPETVGDVLIPLSEVPKNLILSQKAIAYMMRGSSKFSNGRNRFDCYRYPLDGKGTCLTANMWKGVPYGVVKQLDQDGQEVPRRLTAEECERMQGLPIGYTSCVAESHRYKMIGNGWTVPVISHLMKGLLTAKELE